jgi:hypothetical protein
MPSPGPGEQEKLVRRSGFVKRTDRRNATAKEAQVGRRRGTSLGEGYVAMRRGGSSRRSEGVAAPGRGMTVAPSAGSLSLLRVRK